MVVVKDPPPPAASWELFSTMHALIEQRDSRFELLGPVEQSDAVLSRFEASTSACMWNMQRHWSVNELRDTNGLDARARSRGVKLRFILPARVVHERCPLAPSHYDYLRLGPVAHPLMIGDRRRILVGDHTGEGIWGSHDPRIVANAADFFERLWQSSRPAVPDGEQPPFTPRMIQVAFRLVDGATDREIARALGVSERTVSTDIREMSHRLGARSRAEAIARISGSAG